MQLAIDSLNLDTAFALLGLQPGLVELVPLN